MSKRKGKVVPLDSLIRQDLEPTLYKLFTQNFPGFMRPTLGNMCLTKDCTIAVNPEIDPYYCVLCRQKRK